MAGGLRLLGCGGAGLLRWDGGRFEVMASGYGRLWVGWSGACRVLVGGEAQSMGRSLEAVVAVEIGRSWVGVRWSLAVEARVWGQWSLLVEVMGGSRQSLTARVGCGCGGPKPSSQGGGLR